MQASFASSNPCSEYSAAGGGGGGMRKSIESVWNKTKSAEEEDESSFMKKLKSADWERYCFQKDVIRCRPPFLRPDIVYAGYRMKYDSYENQSFPIVQARDLDGGVKHYSFDELMQMTHGFRANPICYALFGTLHRGTIQTESGVQNVLVKTWEYFFPLNGDSQICHHTSRIHDELNLLREPEIKSHPNVVNLIGFHCERRLAVIYEGGSVELLDKIIPNDTFSWGDRLKVATDVAIMLEAFHDKGLVHGGVHSKNIMVDEEKRPVVFDFRLFSYCENRKEYEQYVQKLYYDYDKLLDGPPWSMGHDIFAYGILLLELINKRVYVGFTTPTWMEEEFLDCHRSDHKKSVVDDSFCVEAYVAMGITKLAINCLKVNSDEQPTIRCIVGELEDFKLYAPPNKTQKIFG